MENINALHENLWELKVYVADIAPKMIDSAVLEDRMQELDNLVNTYWGFIIEKKFQKRDNPDLKTYVWKGKLEEIINEMVRLECNLLIIWNILKPRQLFKINEQLREKSEEMGMKEPMRAWDRVDLILKIFDKHASSKEAKLQIELASIRHMWPRIFDMGIELGKQGAGMGSKGSWETNTEIMKRHLQKRQIAIKKDLQEFEKMRNLHRQSRIKKNLPVVWIVGYTNAGKSSLLNALTKKGVLAEDKLFATLGTNVWKMWLENPITSFNKGGESSENFDWENYNYSWGKEILFSDTIWFIRDLPPKLVDAFASTLEDSIESKLLLHVIDASDPFVQERIDTVDQVLEDIGATQPKLMVFNKTDKISEEEFLLLQKKYAEFNPVWISVYEEKWFEELKERIGKMLFD